MPPRPPDRPPTLRRPHPHEFLWEPLAEDPGFVLRSMFGAKAVYLDGRIVACFATSDEPWRGLLVCTDQARHPALRADFPELLPHPVLPKWLYLPEANSAFERLAVQLMRLARRRDPRIGVLPAPRRKSRRRFKAVPRTTAQSKRARRPAS